MGVVLAKQQKEEAVDLKREAFRVVTKFERVSDFGPKRIWAELGKADDPADVQMELVGRIARLLKPLLFDLKEEVEAAQRARDLGLAEVEETMKEKAKGLMAQLDPVLQQMEAAVSAVREHDPKFGSRGGHSMRVARLSLELGKELSYLKGFFSVVTSILDLCDYYWVDVKIGVGSILVTICDLEREIPEEELCLAA